MARRSAAAHGPQYKHLVWNRTDLTREQVGQFNLSYTLGWQYISKKDPFFNSDGNNITPTGNSASAVSEKYKGETIPPYACMRVATNPVIYKDRICWPVCRPDDASLEEQMAGLHFFNGPNPIPFTRDKNGVPNGYGEATQDLPAPVLCDFGSSAGFFQYGNLPNNTAAGSPANWGGRGLNIFPQLVGPFSGSWALHPANDILLSSNVNQFSASGYGGITTQVTVNLAFIAYTVIGQNPVPFRPPPDTFTFWYDPYVMWVGAGSTAITAAQSFN